MTRDQIAARLASLRAVLAEPNKAKLDYSDEVRELASAVATLPGADLNAIEGMAGKASLATVEDIDELARIVAASEAPRVIVH